MIIWENRPKDPIFEKLFNSLSREERNEIWEEITGFEYESPVVKEHEINKAKKAFDEGIKEGLNGNKKN